MATGYSPRIVTDGLVLALDAGNVKSFRGEPTTNLLSQPTSINNWATQQATVDATPAFVREIDGNLIPFYKVTSTVITDPFIILTTAVGNISNRTFTYSVYLFTDPGQPTTSIQLYTYGNVPSFEGSSVTSATLTITSTPTRYKLTSTYGAGFNSTSLANRVDLNSSTLGYLYVGGAQLEEKAYETRFVAGTRGTTVATGGGWADKSGGNRHGELVNGPTYNSSNLGSLVFDGVNDYVNTTLSNTSFTSLNCSLEILFNTGVIQNNKFTTLAGQRSGGDSRTLLGLWIEARNSWPGNYSSNYGILGITFGTVVHADIAIKSTPGTIIDNTWYHVILVSSNVDTKMYINGNLVSTLVSSGTLNTSVAGTFGVGCYGISSGTLQYPSNLSNQKIPINRVYNKALTSVEVLQNYNATKGRFGL